MMKDASQPDLPTPKNPGSQRTRLTPAVSELDHVQGLPLAAVTLVEYGDYLDPRCAAAQPWIKTLQAQMGDGLRLVFRHFPASTLSPHAAEAAEAAGLQDCFWEMHDTIFAHQSALGNGYLVEYAQGIGLDVNRFLRDMAGHVSVARVHLDTVSGTRSGVPSTPTFFVNGVRQLTTWEVCLGTLMTNFLGTTKPLVESRESD